MEHFFPIQQTIAVAVRLLRVAANQWLHAIRQTIIVTVCDIRLRSLLRLE